MARRRPSADRYERRLTVGILLGVLLGSLVVARLVQVQVVEASTFRREAISQQERTLPLRAVRGSVRWRDGEVIATTLPADRRGKEEASRLHPHGALAAQVVGFVSPDGRGQEGIELMFEDALHGADGERVVSANARGYLQTSPDGQVRPPEDGSGRGAHAGRQGAGSAGARAGADGGDHRRGFGHRHPHGSPHRRRPGHRLVAELRPREAASLGPRAAPPPRRDRRQRAGLHVQGGGGGRLPGGGPGRAGDAHRVVRGTGAGRRPHPARRRGLRLGLGGGDADAVRQHRHGPARPQGGARRRCSTTRAPSASAASPASTCTARSAGFCVVRRTGRAGRWRRSPSARKSP